MGHRPFAIAASPIAFARRVPRSRRLWRLKGVRVVVVRMVVIRRFLMMTMLPPLMVLVLVLLSLFVVVCARRGSASGSRLIPCRAIACTSR